MSLKKSIWIAALAVAGLVIFIGYGVYTDCKGTSGYSDCSGL